MARSPTGTFTLVAGNPVITGTIITSDWANTTMPDIGAALTDSLSRTGQGGMLAPFRGVSGSATSPAHSFTNFPRSGEYAVSADETRMAVNGVDRMRWREAGQPTQTYDSAAGEWRDLGGGGTVWRYEPTIPATVLAGIGYVTAGGQSTLLPANPLSGEAVSFADLNNDWDETPFTLDGNGNTFSQDGSSTYELNLKGAYAHFAFINNEWVIVNFGRLSDAYGLDLDSFVKKDDPNANLIESAYTSGDYNVIRYEDGRLIMEGLFPVNVPADTPSVTFTINYPEPFIGGYPRASMSIQNAYGNRFGYAQVTSVQFSSTNGALVRDASTGSNTSGTSTVAFTLTGRWK